MTALRVGVVGVGHLGRHHARILAGLEGVTLIGVADRRLEQARAVAAPLGTEAFEDYRDLLDRVDAVSIAVPTSLHHEVASAFLKRGIPVMVEKPLTAQLSEAEELVALADSKGLVLQVGHIERFNPILKTLDGLAVQPKYIEAERLGIYTFRSTDIGVVHDLMIHDIDLLLSMVQAPVVAVSALGLSVFGGLEDLAKARIWFEDGTIADLTASRASMQGTRKMRLWGAQGYISLDFQARQAQVVQPSEQLRQGCLDTEGVDLADPEALRSHLFGKVLRVDRVQAEGREPLALELEEFVRSVRGEARPRVSGTEALHALRLADRIVQGIEAHAWEGDLGGPTGPNLWSSAHPGLPEPKLWKYARSPKSEQVGDSPSTSR